MGLLLLIVVVCVAWFGFLFGPELFYRVKYLGSEPGCEECGGETKFFSNWDNGDVLGPKGVAFECSRCNKITNIILPS